METKYAQVEHCMEQRARVRRAFGELRHHLALCRRDPDYGFAVSDLDSLRVFLCAHCEERQFARELIAAGRLTVPDRGTAAPDDPVNAEWMRRNALHWSKYWEGVLGGSAEAIGANVGAPIMPPVVRVATEAVLRAEKAATLAALAGARYPDLALDKAWRQVLAARGDEAAEGEVASLDLLAVCREAMELAEEVTARALFHVARAVDTADGKGKTKNGKSLVVFNLSGRREAAICRARVELSGNLASGFELLDSRGHAVRYQLVSASRLGEANWVEISFSAADLPCVGYATYGLRATDQFPEPASLSETRLEGGATVALQTAARPGPLPPELDLVSVDARNVTIVTVRPVGEHCAFVRLHECEGRPVNAVAAFGSGLEQAWRADWRERKTEEVPAPRFSWRRTSRLPVTLAAGDSTNLVVALKPLPQTAEGEEIGPSAEPYSPVYCRYWDHNLGAAPIGNLPLGLWANGALPIGRNTRFPMCLSNDTVDREFVGAVHVLAPEQWTVLPRHVPYRLPSASQALYEITAIVPEGASPCFLRLTTEQGGQTIQEVLPVGETKPLQVSLTRDDDGFVVCIANPNSDYIEGQIALITPPGTWGLATGPPARATVKPRLQPFRVEANGSEMTPFAAEGDLSGAWVVAKVTWYGHVQYVREAPG